MNLAYYLDSSAIKKYYDEGSVPAFYANTLGTPAAHADSPSSHVYVRARELALALLMVYPPDATNLNRAVPLVYKIWAQLRKGVCSQTTHPNFWLVIDGPAGSYPVQLNKEGAATFSKHIREEVGKLIDIPIGRTPNDPASSFKEALRQTVDCTSSVPAGPLPVMVVGSVDNPPFEYVTLAC